MLNHLVIILAMVLPTLGEIYKNNSTLAEESPVNNAFPVLNASHQNNSFHGVSHSHDGNGSIWHEDSWSRSEECTRTCVDGEKPRTCYYHFTLELYATMSRACEVCRPNSTNQLLNKPQCQCVEADGFERSMLSVNRMFPGPSIQVCENDKIIVDVQNKMGGMEATLHWHGVFQQGSQYYDGVPFITQCPISSGTTFRYQFVAGNPGSHFYHSHSGLQKVDGLTGSLIIRQTPSRDPNWSLYDEDLPMHVIFLSDWLHEMAVDRFPGRISRNVGQFPDSFLINGRGRWTNPSTNETTNITLETLEVEPGKRYRFRMINALSMVCPVQMSIEGHTLTIIAQDGESVKPSLINTIVSHSSERVDFVLNATKTIGVYWIQLKGLGECAKDKIHQLAILRYKGASANPETPEPSYDDALQEGIVYNPMDAICDVKRPNAICANQLESSKQLSEELLKPKPDYHIVLPVRFHVYDFDVFEPGTYQNHLQAMDGTAVVSLMDEISFEFPPVPPISQELAEGQTCNRYKKPANCKEPCKCPHVHDVKKGAVVEVVIYDETPELTVQHPFHLHGHAFSVFKIGRFTDGRNISKSDIDNVIRDHQTMLNDAQYSLPPGKDTVLVPSGGYVIFRFKADNPGWWLFHCHYAFHISNGMSMVFHVGEKKDLPPVPKNFPQCSSFLPEA